MLPLALLSIRATAVCGALAVAAFLGAGPARGTPGLPVARAGATVTAPHCTPQTLDASAQLAGAVTVSPMPGAADASPQTQISFLGVPLGDLRGVTVVGSDTGAHTGKLEAYSQGDGGSFVPGTPFRAGETVTVTAKLTVAGVEQPLRFRFSVADEDALTRTPETLHHLDAGSTQSFVSRPDLSPPLVTVHTHSAQLPAGDVLLAPYGVPGQAGPMILDPGGKLLWFDPLPPTVEAANLRVQQYEGAPVLTWWQGTITTHGFGLGVDVIESDRYATIAEVRAGNGYQADLHEFQITPAGTALLTAYNAIDCDLAGVGGRREAAVTDSLFQEIDIRTGLVMYEWTALDHVALSDSYGPASTSSTSWPFDFFHLNSINLDSDGTFLVSSRNTWAAYDIDAQSGRLLWTLGGKHSSFTEGRGAATAYQHDARPAGPGTYSVFDNGATPQVHDQSRGVVLAINQASATVTVVSQYRHPGARLLAGSQGNMQALPGGDWFVGWGQEPYFSEFNPAGGLLFDASLPAGYESYRALSFPWVATPTRPPALALREDSAGRTLAYVSWNGATQVARWELVEGASPSTLEPVTSVPRDGFETAIELAASDGRERVIEVRALDASGATLGTSSTVALAAVAHASGSVSRGAPPPP